MKPLLTIIVISHNQRDVLHRCIESIFAQETTFSIEVIVSDDHSTDGTREMLANEYAGRVMAVYCNSDECHPNYTLERAGYNRLNGLKYATGKYLIHLDGDDYYVGSDCFEKMVKTLDSHPECTLCCQNYKWVEAGTDDALVQPFSKSNLFEQEAIITGEQYVWNIGFIHNSAVCMRRGETANLQYLSPNTYDDADITFRYMRAGKIALINKADFVYVQYKNSSCSTMTRQEKDFIFPNGVSSIQLNIHLANVLLRKNVGIIKSQSKQIVMGSYLPERMVDYFKNFRMFLFNALTYRNQPLVRLRYCAILITCILICKGKIQFNWMYKLLYNLVV